MSDTADRLAALVSAFVKSCGRHYEFPAGGVHQLLTPQELELLEALRRCRLPTEQQIATLSGNRDWSDSYSLAIFGVRLSIMAARKNDPTTYRIGLLALVAGSPKVDWRDVMGAFAIFETCGKQLSLDFQEEVSSLVRFGDAEKLWPTLEGFFSRDEEMRSVDVMGYEKLGEGDTLTYRAKGMF